MREGGVRRRYPQLARRVDLREGASSCLFSDPRDGPLNLIQIDSATAENKLWIDQFAIIVGP